MNAQADDEGLESFREEVKPLRERVTKTLLEGAMPFLEKDGTREKGVEDVGRRAGKGWSRRSWPWRHE